MRESVSTSTFYVSLGYLRPLFDYLRKHNHPLDPYLEQLGITHADLVNPDLHVEDKDFNSLFEIAEAQTGDSNIGLHMGQSMQFHHLGIVGMLLMTCRRAKEIFELHQRYQSIVGNGLFTSYTTEGDEVCMHVQLGEDIPYASRHTYEFSFGGWFNLRNLAIGEEQPLLRVELPYARPPDESDLQALFKAPIRYDCESLRIYFPATFGELELIAADPQLKQMLESEAVTKLQELQRLHGAADPKVENVRQRIARHLAYGAPTVEVIAAELEVSVRTLQRQLDQSGSTYKALVDEVRSELARKYIDNPELSLLDVAMMLGFAEQSSFQRAFKRWYGDTPGGFRRSRTLS